MGFWDLGKPPFFPPLLPLPPHRAQKLGVAFLHIPNASRLAASGDPVTGTPLGINSCVFARLGLLWLTLPYTLSECRDVPELVAALLRTWIPIEAGAPRKLTLTPSYESDFMRAEFADVLRAVGPVIEHVFGERSLDAEGEGGEEKVELREGDDRGAGVEVEVCVVDRAEMREWWRGEARASFARLAARGRLDVSFEKGESSLRFRLRIRIAHQGSCARDF